MKKLHLTFLFSLLFAAPTFVFSNADIRASQGGPNGYDHLCMVINDDGTKVIDCSGHGYSKCQFIQPLIPTQYDRENPEEYKEYTNLAQIASASIKAGVLSGKIVSTTGAYSCEWRVADKSDLSTFEIKLRTKR